MIVVVAAVEQRLVDPDLRFLHEALPDRVALLGGTKSEEAECRVGQAVLGGGFGERLRRDAAGREIDQVVILERGLTGGAVKFPERESHVTGFIRAGLLVIDGKDGTIGLNRVEIVAQHRAGHVETLLGKTMHAVEYGGRKNRATSANGSK